MTETSPEPSPISLEEDDDTEGSKEQRKETSFECNEKKFITSPADIDIHRKINFYKMQKLHEGTSGGFQRAM